MAGPLAGIRIVEFAGIGPAPFCGMMLGDHGAEVIRVERPGWKIDPKDALARNRKSIILNTKDPEDLKIALALCRGADGLIEGYRPGVMERLGLGPEVLLADNPRLVYGRMTGWGQYGSFSQMAGHDINYIALSGVLHTVGLAGQRPTPPVNYVGDFGGGAMMLAFGMVSALLNVKMGGVGQVIDAAITDGSALMAAMSYSFLASGQFEDVRGVNMIDGGAHFYDTYECADGKWIAIGALEPQFYALLRKLVGVSEDSAFDRQHDRSLWSSSRSKLATIFLSKTRDEWCELMEGTDACFAPVLSMTDAPHHPHNVERKTFVEVDGSFQPAPAPRYSVTDNAAPVAPAGADADRELIMASLLLE